MKQNTRQLDYMTKDFMGFKELMKSYIPILAPQWTDMSDNDFGIVLMDLLCLGLDVVSYYQDKAVNESLLPTARTRKAVIRLSSFLGYTLKQHQPARFKMLFRKRAGLIGTVSDVEVRIPRGTLIGTDPQLGTPIVFETDADLVIPTGAVGIEKNQDGEHIYAVTATQGYTITEPIGKGTGAINQTYKLTYEGAMIDSTLEVRTEENGLVKVWKRVDDFLSSTPSHLHYTAKFNEYDEVTIQFGNGVTGAVVPAMATVKSTYRIVNGSLGNVGLNKVNSFMDNHIPEIDTLYNPETPIVYGIDAEHIETAKIQAPKNYKTNDRAVTKEDFETFALKVPYITKAKAIETYNLNNDLIVHVTSDGNVVPQMYKNMAMELLNAKKLINCNVIIRDVEVVGYSVQVSITTHKEHSNNNVKLLVQAKLAELLDVKAFDIGQELYLGDIVATIQSMPEVKRMTILSPVSDIDNIGETSLLKCDNISVDVTGGM